MKIGQFFNRKARAAVASVAILFGAAGGYAGHQMAQEKTQPQLSNYTLTQAIEQQDKLTQNFDREYFPAALPADATPSVASQMAEEDAVIGFVTRISAMQENKDMRDITADAVSFVNDLRLSENISERDYAALVRDYNARVNVDVTPITGNWQDGIMYQQEANLGAKFSAAFGGWFGDDDEDVTPQQMSKDIGQGMSEGQNLYDNAGLKGAAGGALLGSMLFLPLYLRQRNRHPKVK